MKAMLEAYTQGWVTDGNYSRVADIPLETADTIIWLHRPLRVTFPRVFRRTLYRVRSGKPFYASNGPIETFRQSFLSRHSNLLWSLSNHLKTARSIRARIEMPHKARVYEVRTSKDLVALMRAAQRQAAAES